VKLKRWTILDVDEGLGAKWRPDPNGEHMYASDVIPILAAAREALREARVVVTKWTSAQICKEPNCQARPCVTLRDIDAALALLEDVG
jgi:hypothetical protein